MTPLEYLQGTVCAFILGIAAGMGLMNRWWRERDRK